MRTNQHVRDEGVLISPQKALEEVSVELGETAIAAYPHAVLLGCHVVGGEHPATPRAMMFRGPVRRVLTAMRTCGIRFHRGVRPPRPLPATRLLGSAVVE